MPKTTPEPMSAEHDEDSNESEGFVATTLSFDREYADSVGVPLFGPL